MRSYRQRGHACSRRNIHRTMHLFLGSVNRSPRHRNLIRAPSHVTHTYHRLFTNLRTSPTSILRGRFSISASRLILIGSVRLCSIYRRRLLPFRNITRINCVPTGSKIVKLDGLTQLIRICTHHPRIRRQLARRVTSTLIRCTNTHNIVIIARYRRLYVSVHNVGGSSTHAIASTIHNVLHGPTAQTRTVDLVLSG